MQRRYQEGSMRTAQVTGKPCAKVMLASHHNTGLAHYWSNQQHVISRCSDALHHFQVSDRASTLSHRNRDLSCSSAIPFHFIDYLAVRLVEPVYDSSDILARKHRCTHPGQSKTGSKGKKEKFTHFSDHNRSLLRRQPRAKTGSRRLTRSGNSLNVDAELLGASQGATNGR